MADLDPERALAREDMCRFLSACYYEPGPEFAEERLFDSIANAAGRIDPQLAELAHRLRDAYLEQDAQTVLIDYTRLFLGPMEPLARPYGSYWLSGETTLMQDTTLAVQALYQEGGMDLGDEVRELPDHVAIELEFLYRLIFRRNEAQRAGQADELAGTEALERRFLDEHLGRWIGRFTDAARAGAATSFYRTLAELTERFVRMEQAGLATLH
jgi:putative dimethyl sulfoxide reductase chaperone